MFRCAYTSITSNKTVFLPLIFDFLSFAVLLRFCLAKVGVGERKRKKLKGSQSYQDSILRDLTMIMLYFHDSKKNSNDFLVIQGLL
jgi:hypothetical protein